MHLDLSPAEQAFRDEVRAFLAEHLTPGLRHGQRFTTGVYPEPEISGPWQAALRRRGWLVPMWEKEWGGTGWSAAERFIFDSECALAGAPLVHPMGVRLVGPVLQRFGTEEQKRHYLPRILDGQDYWCQGFSEPGAGSDLASLKMAAVADGDDYLLNGSKIWTTHAHHANMMFALVRTSSAGKRQEGISFLLIDMDTPGIDVRPIATIGGDHDVNQVFFTDVRVPKANLVGRENGGWDCAKYLLEFERGGGIFSGRLRSQLKRIGDAIAELRASGVDVRADARLVARFGEVCADLDTFEMFELRVMGALAPGQSPGPVSSVLKLRASRMKQAVADLGIELLGPQALHWSEAPQAQDSLLPLLVADALNSRSFTIFGGASEVQLTLIAKDVAGV